MDTTFFTAAPEQSLRFRCKALWESGDFGVVARYSEAAAAAFMARLPLRAGDRVLDVACGTGNLAVVAARAGCATCGLDLATNLISQARSRAAVEGLSIEFTEGSAESLPYPDAHFDFVLSMFGVMYAPRPERAAAELLRVCRPGGTIALANWTPDGFEGEIARIVGRFVPPPPGADSALGWGDESTVLARLGERARVLRTTRRTARFYYPFAPARTVDFLRQFYGPTLRAFAVLDAAGQTGLAAALSDFYQTRNRAGCDETEFDAEYLEVVLIRR